MATPARLLRWAATPRRRSLATGAQILQPDITSGFKSGYVFTISNCQKVTVNGTDRVTSYMVTGVPQTVGKTGDSGFCSDQFGTIKQDPHGRHQLHPARAMRAGRLLVGAPTLKGHGFSRAISRIPRGFRL
jgi:hypothetical protein